MAQLSRKQGKDQIQIGAQRKAHLIIINQPIRLQYPILLRIFQVKFVLKSNQLPTYPLFSYSRIVFTAEENPSAYESVQLHDPWMPSKDYVLAGKCDLTLAQEKKIQALVEKIRPQIPVLVAQMKKSNVDRGCGTLVR
jgi:hypothetical protein